jgi:hypothetical protein
VAACAGPADKASRAATRIRETTHFQFFVNIANTLPFFFHHKGEKKFRKPRPVGAFQPLFQYLGFHKRTSKPLCRVGSCTAAYSRLAERTLCPSTTDGLLLVVSLLRWFRAEPTLPRSARGSMVAAASLLSEPQRHG